MGKRLGAKILVSSTLLFAACSASEASSTGLAFVDVAKEAGLTLVNKCGDARRWYIPESNGCGAAWLDYDSDGDVDLFVGNGASLVYHDDGARLEVLNDVKSTLYRNDGGLRFSDVGEESGAAIAAWINAIAVGDVDNDGDPDLYLACFGEDRFLRNEGGHFVDATRAAGLGNSWWGAGAAFGDANNDGHLDLYVANYCQFDPQAPPAGGKRQNFDGVEVGFGPEAENKQGYNLGAPDLFFLGNGDGSFREATAAAGLNLQKPLCSYAVVFSDVDLDGWQDILVANDLQACNLFRNQGGGHFRDEAQERGFATDASGKATAAMGLFVEDVDQDGDQDVLRTNFDLEANALHINNGAGIFRDCALAAGLAQPSVDRLGWGGVFFDADSDGDHDLFVANGHVLANGEQIGLQPWLQSSQLFEAVAGGALGIQWRDVSAASGAAIVTPRSARGVAQADPDGDGDLDLVVIDIDQPPRLLENRTTPKGTWIAVRTRGTRSNRDGLGARVTVSSGGKHYVREVRLTSGLYSSHAPELFFGLGWAKSVDAVSVHWPSGEVQRIAHPPLGKVLDVIEPDGSGS